MTETVPIHLFTVEQVAQRLNLHAKTIRRYIRDGRLKAKRLGKEYRVARADLDEFAGSTQAADEPVTRTRQVIASTIVDVHVIGPDESHRITTMLMAGLNARKGEPDFPRVDTIYYEEHARLRITMTASLALTIELLRMIHVLLEDRRGGNL